MGPVDAFLMWLQGWRRVKKAGVQWSPRSLFCVELPAGLLVQTTSDGIFTVASEADGWVINLSAVLAPAPVTPGEAKALTYDFARDRRELSPRVERRTANAECIDVELAGSESDAGQCWFYRLAYRGAVAVTATVNGSADDLAHGRRDWLPVLDSLRISEAVSAKT